MFPQVGKPEKRSADHVCNLVVELYAHGPATQPLQQVAEISEHVGLARAEQTVSDLRCFLNFPFEHTRTKVSVTIKNRLRLSRMRDPSATPMITSFMQTQSRLSRLCRVDHGLTTHRHTGDAYIVRCLPDMCIVLVHTRELVFCRRAFFPAADGKKSSSADVQLPS